MSKATTQLSFTDTQTYSDDSKIESSSSNASRPRNFFSLNLARSRAASDEDAASVTSAIPPDGGVDAESILGEVLDRRDDSLLRTLGSRFRSQESESVFSAEPDFDEAFRHEFDEIDEMASDGSNEGLDPQSLDVDRRPMLMECNRISYAPVAHQVEALPHPFICRQAHLQ